MKKQHEMVLSFIEDHKYRTGKFPSMRTISAGVGYGLTWVHRYINELVEEGLLEKSEDRFTFRR